MARKKKGGIPFYMAAVGPKEIDAALRKFNARDRVLVYRAAMRKSAKYSVARLKNESPRSVDPLHKNLWRERRGLTSVPPHGYMTSHFAIKVDKQRGGLVGYFGWRKSWAWYAQILSHGFMNVRSGQMVPPDTRMTKIILWQAQRAVNLFPRDFRAELYRRLHRRFLAANRKTRSKARALRRGRARRR